MKQPKLILCTIALLLSVTALPNPCPFACISGTKCYLGKCTPIDQIPKTCSKDADCMFSSVCDAGQCVFKGGVGACVPACLAGENCSNGKCVKADPVLPAPGLPNPCPQGCPDGTKCYLSKCTPIAELPPDCFKDVDCGGESYFCEQGQCVFRDPTLTCTPACQTGFNCVNGGCVLSVVGVNCKSNTECVAGYVCEKGSCVKDPSVPVKVCNKLCVIGYKCLNGECVKDGCSYGDCPPNQVCFEGACINRPFDPICSVSTDCASGQICQKGVCVVFKPCNKLCIIGTHCVNGECVKNSCTTDDDCKSDQFCRVDVCFPRPVDPLCYVNADCKKGQVCQKGKCVTPTIKPCLKLCIIGSECINGECVPKDKCATVKCKPGFQCVAGLCVKQTGTDTTGTCSSSDDCADEERCENGKCVYACMTAKCGGGTICLHGGCSLPPLKCKIDSDCGVGEKCHKLGKCVNKCSGVTCQDGKTCVQGKCENQKCGKVTCAAGTYCKANKCVPDANLCPANTKHEPKACPIPRPTESNCGPFFYIRAPDPAYCGVKADGTRINYFEECTTCIDKDIIYYFTAPCHKVEPFVCLPSDTCNDFYCSARCQNNDVCPYDWQICLDGRCIDRCAAIRCAKGPCKFGQCAFEEPGGACNFASNPGCKEGLSCVGFECADLCLRQACSPYQNCDKGNCVADRNRA